MHPQQVSDINLRAYIKAAHACGQHELHKTYQRSALRTRFRQQRESFILGGNEEQS